MRHFNRKSQPGNQGFTLIELLIVVAIIAILAAIAVPNFLEAQTRSKVSRAAADMRTIDTAMQSYLVDHNRQPLVQTHGTNSPPAWWGFISTQLTTPVAYLTSIPVMPFIDETVLGFWQLIGGNQNNQPYTIVRDTRIPASWPVGATFGGGAPAGVPNNAPIGRIFNEEVKRSAYIIYTSGPDAVDGTVWGVPEYYDPTNGTISYGDIYRFGGGSPVTEDSQ
ncbi:MAG: prepilin-type N-terminal cleavage/methylation domain-containing protein [Candidatus Sumerlaeia bacterium]|nr:prepilin-type N-terminal cleavage/methylation domain-containing protein [Candidatus Sumerlaeia bacterium]